MAPQRFDPRTRMQDLAGLRFQTPGGPWRPLVFQNKEGQWTVNPHAPVTSEYGNRTHPVHGDVRHHNGIDIGLQSGTRLAWKGEGNLQAIKDNPSGQYGGYGNLTLFQPAGTDFSIKSAHLGKLPMGNLKDMGLTDLGFVGSTGTSTGPHLHMEVLGKGTPAGSTPAPPQSTPPQAPAVAGQTYNVNIDLAGLLGKKKEQEPQKSFIDQMMDSLLTQAMTSALSPQGTANNLYEV